MTFEEYNYYGNMAIRLFNYMNGQVNIVNRNCHLHVCMYDNINFTFGYIEHPNHVYIHIGNIVDMWDDYFDPDRPDMIANSLAWIIAHELSHADQLMSIINYRRDSVYKEKIEKEAQKESYMWIANNAKELSAIGGFDVKIRELTAIDLDLNAVYNRVTPKEFYRQTIYNTVLRDLTSNRIEALDNDSYSFNTLLDFGGSKNNMVQIKYNGLYREDIIPVFADMVYRNFGMYSQYNLTLGTKDIPMPDGTRSTIIHIESDDQLINPMVFKFGTVQC